MSLAGENQVNRPLVAGEEPGQPLAVPHQQCCPLVGGEASGESDDQSVGVELVPGGLLHQIAQDYR